MLASSVSYTAFDTLDVYFDDVAESCLPLRIILLCTLNLFNAIWTYAPTSLIYQNNILTLRPGIRVRLSSAYIELGERAPLVPSFSTQDPRTGLGPMSDKPCLGITHSAHSCVKFAQQGFEVDELQIFVHHDVKGTAERVEHISVA